jgi:hypothetical protein
MICLIWYQARDAVAHRCAEILVRSVYIVRGMSFRVCGMLGFISSH